MKKIIFCIVFLLAFLIPLNVFAYTPFPKPENNGYVLDKADKLSGTEILSLNQKIDELSKKTKNQMGVLIIPALDGESISDIANTTFNAWGIGNKELNNGVLLVIAIKDRKTRLEVGKGIEGEIPDLKASDILEKELKPHLKRGNFAKGISATIDAIYSALESKTLPNPPNGSSSKNKTKLSPSNFEGSQANNDVPGWFIASVLGGFSLLVIFFSWLFVSTNKKSKKYSSDLLNYYPLPSTNFNRKTSNNTAYRQKVTLPVIEPIVITPPKKVVKKEYSYSPNYYSTSKSENYSTKASAIKSSEKKKYDHDSTPISPIKTSYTDTSYDYSYVTKNEPKSERPKSSRRQSSWFSSDNANAPSSNRGSDFGGFGGDGGGGVSDGGGSDGDF